MDDGKYLATKSGEKTETRKIWLHLQNEDDELIYVELCRGNEKLPSPVYRFFGEHIPIIFACQHCHSQFMNLPLNPQGQHSRKTGRELVCCALRGNILSSACLLHSDFLHEFTNYEYFIFPLYLLSVPLAMITNLFSFDWIIKLFFNPLIMFLPFVRFTG